MSAAASETRKRVADMSDEHRKRMQRRIGIGGGLGGAAWGLLYGLWSTGLISTSVFGVLLIVPVGLFFVVTRNLALLGKSGAVARPIWRYNRDFLCAMAAYVAAMFVAIGLWNSDSGAREFAWAIALLPMLPTFAMIYVMGRYLTEETDEFQRHRVIMSAIVGLGFVLVLGTGWGFLETFSVVPNIWAWWVVPGWAIGLGLGQAWFGLRDERHDAQDDS